MKREYAPEEMKALIIQFLYRRRRLGERYFPLDTMVNWLSVAVKNNGKKLREAVKILANEGYILYHKKGETVSLNVRMKAYIEKLIA